MTARTGSTDQPYQFVGELGYYTHYQDLNLDLLHLGFRFYDPEIGRFTQVDPARDGLNLYVYVRNEPTRSIDPTGLVAKVDPQRYWDCKTKGGYIRLFEVWCRQEKRYDTWKLSKCLAKASCTNIVIVAYCVSIFMQTKDPGAFVLCMQGALGPEFAANAVSIKECFDDEDNFRWETVIYKIHACQYPGKLIDWLDKDRPRGRGWTLCD